MANQLGGDALYMLFTLVKVMRFIVLICIEEGNQVTFLYIDVVNPGLSGI